MVVVPAATGVTIPAADIFATLVSVLTQLPPGVVFSNVLVDPIHTVGLPAIGAGDGNGFTFTLCFTTLVPHRLVVVYLTVSKPPAIPVTTPAALTVTLPVVVAHVPPATVAVRVMLSVWHTAVAPVTNTGAGIAFIVTDLVL